VYDKGDRIARLSSDAATHCLIACANEIGGLAVPKMYRDYGAVGVSDDYPDWDHYWLAELEKMTPLKDGSVELLGFSTWLDELIANIDDEPLVPTSMHEQLLATLGEYPSDHQYHAIIKTLDQLTRWCDGEIDLSISNFMLRPSTGEIVVVDPAHGMSVNAEEWNARLAQRAIAAVQTRETLNAD